MRPGVAGGFGRSRPRPRGSAPAAGRATARRWRRRGRASAYRRRPQAAYPPPEARARTRDLRLRLGRRTRGPRARPPARAQDGGNGSSVGGKPGRGRILRRHRANRVCTGPRLSASPSACTGWPCGCHTLGRQGLGDTRRDLQAPAWVPAQRAPARCRLRAGFCGRLARSEATASSRMAFGSARARGPPGVQGRRQASGTAASRRRRIGDEQRALDDDGGAGRCRQRSLAPQLHGVGGLDPEVTGIEPRAARPNGRKSVHAQVDRRRRRARRTGAAFRTVASDLLVQPHWPSSIRSYCSSRASASCSAHRGRPRGRYAVWP
jgi:hypothetical protein